MSADLKRIIVNESRCTACDVYAIQIYHESFPELRIEGESAELAAEHLVDRLVAALDSVADATHRAAVLAALDDVRTFLGPKGTGHLARTRAVPTTS